MEDLIYIGNFKDWIKDEWLEHLLNHDGDLLPKNLKNEDDESVLPKWDDGFNASVTENFERDIVYCISYQHHNFPFKITANDLPIDIGDKNFEFSFIKYNPGMIMPIHIDHPLYGRKFVDGEPQFDPKIERYWMSLLDYERGHVLLHNHKLFKDYKQGDLYKFQNEMDWHGSANLGKNVRLIFNFTTW